MKILCPVHACEMRLHSAVLADAEARWTLDDDIESIPLSDSPNYQYLYVCRYGCRFLYMTKRTEDGTQLDDVQNQE